MGIFTVSELNQHVKNVLRSEPGLQQVWVRGEISNLTLHRSGHYYFTIKDSKAQISCVCFSSVSRKIKFQPEKSMSILAFGSIDLYTVRGQYQLQILDMRPDGIGELYQAFEQLKNRLEKEGLFEIEHKKPIPKYPSRIGIVTSPTGAAIHDILNVAQRRLPVDLLLAPALVQGERSASSVANAIEMLNNTDVDVIILGRGGGSLEDLWSFNEEIVARAIHDSNVPIVSAVGHETDYTIADFTADLRAPTPSAACEMVIPSSSELEKYIDSLIHRIIQSTDQKIKDHRTDLKYLHSRVQPEKFRDHVLQNYQKLDETASRMEYIISNLLRNKKSFLREYAGRLDAVSPLQTLARGYSITMDTEGNIIHSVNEVTEADDIEIMIHDGIIECSVRNITRTNKR
ncbi:exodeoxyribonuclease VII, large subunit [Methanosalsum zhilinae DSM 4017]|uniref:Exodeoxyribonuclease VII, large subunit n=1 Tax=Methanosalsum zhilinae (strain DSM 4017 / NBRC 107636 / OCM 62 / WeN5) TaxID=679901 RepID=F7XQN8_METZD|nr:exodeoxyribonuclease VII large subunit [Methanosalsum zhilinae]AEH61637.1 exodeoxyribonuclease VII, large subunit [Methanosalsum zhilinae DSM 4017]